MNIVILAAGRGTRMRSERPKVLHRLAGQPLLAHVLKTARALKPTRLVVVYGHGGQAVPDSFPGADIIWVKQEPQLGTGHAVLQAIPKLDASLPTLVLSGDVPLIRPETLLRLKSACEPDAPGQPAGELAVLTVFLDEPFGYGRMVRADGRVTGIVEEKDASPEEREIHEVNSGIMYAQTGALTRWLSALSNENAQGEYYLTDIVGLCVAEGVPVRTAQTVEPWETLGVNSKAQLAELERRVQSREAARLLEAGVTVIDPTRLDVRGELTVDTDVTIDINCIFEGRVHLASGVSIGASCVLRDVAVAENTVIEPFCHIDGAKIGQNAHIGPFARLRPGAELASDVHIGNFVEVKNAQIGIASKANHLAYIGDATVGARVNIGAGTITVNYDGANKHRTVIADDVHIGSDSQLIAPVEVGAGATVAAGTTIWKDVEAGSLALNEKKQVSKPGWTRPKKK